MWTTFAKCQLSVRAIGEALTASGLGVEGARLTSAEIVSCCAGFIRIEPVNDRYRHLSITRAEAVSSYTETDCLDYSMVTFTHLSARHHCESNQETYFPNAMGDIWTALISDPDTNPVTEAFGAHYVFMNAYGIATFPTL